MMKRLFQVLVFVYIFCNTFQIYAQRKISFGAELERADIFNSYSKFTNTWFLNFSETPFAVPTITVITSNHNPSQPAENITFTSTTTSGGSPVSIGTISFTKNNVAISGCTNLSLNSNGRATCTTSLLDGTGTITARYSGATNFGISDGSIFIRATQLRLGIAYGSSLFSNKEQFEFALANGQKVVMSSTNPTAYFTTQFATGQNYSITQTAGPRTCSFFQQERGTFASQDIVITASCGNPQFSIFKLQVSGIEQGEIFKFADNYRRTYQYPFSTTANLGGYPVGDDYAISQTEGPRKCKMTNNQGVVPSANLTVVADCSKTAVNPPINNNGNSGNSFVSNVKSDLISRSTDDKSLGTYYENWTPVIGGKGEDEGRYVAFVSQTAGIGGSTGKFRQIMWRDRKTGETKMISASASGGEGNQNSLAPAISADGRSVAFESYATNLVPVDTNGVRDIFVWNADRNTITAVSTGQGETETNYQSYEPTISGDGNLIAFTSDATNLIPNIMGQSSTNVYLKDIRSGSIKIISLDEKTKKGGGGSNPSISEDGSRIAFYNYASLTTEDKNNLWDIYIWDSGNPKLKRVSTTVERGDKNQGDDSSSRVVAPAISGNGKYVAYSTTASNIVGGDTNKTQDVFVVEIDSVRVSRVSVGTDGAEGNGDSPIGQGEKIAISYDGSLVALSTKSTNLGGNILLRNLNSNQTIPISAETGLTVGQPVMSRNGSYVVFGTSRQLDGRFKSSGLFAILTNVSQ